MINNSEDLNNYYRLVNQYIDEYIEKGINPLKLGKYLNKSKLKNFLERKGLDTIQNIDKIVQDVIDDRISLEKDSVLKFESFKIFESNNISFDSVRECLYRNIGSSDINHEKILADFYDVSLSQIDVISSEEHSFKVNKFGDEVKCIIYTQDDLKIIGENLKSLIIEEINTKFIELDYQINIPVDKITDPIKIEKYLEEYIDVDMVKNIISLILKCGSEKVNEDYPHFIGLV